MHPLVQSPTTTTFKTKWNTIKDWFTPDLAKRRPSHCSTTSTNTTATTSSSCRCKEDTFIPSHTKRPSLTNSLNEGVLDKCMSPFRRRPSNASCATSTSTINDDMDKEIEKLYELYNFAMDEINYAEDSRGSPYYQGDRISAKEAIDQCDQTYKKLTQKFEIDSTIAYKISTLSIKFDSLPLQDDQRSI
ncbi:hypothetical protein EDC94DRAFT_620987 [Helicostylum pulchrum]|uniref:Uncharacterized protein n=1 Tax=Helicostylum pulchrum TaxID=562976 RepID=A0ABP9XU91_9FUNG|nr:hypothetical protein EDC94DRAFT_620987 [Helicostylum pulchrum]